MTAPVEPDRPDGLLRRMEAVDRWADARLEPWRGNPTATLAATVVSNLADYGFVWSVVAAVKGRRSGPARRRAVTRLAAAGVLSSGVNALAKRAVGRSRPDGAAPEVPGPGLPVRRPTSSSFPSGHTLASFCTAVVVADGPGEMAAYLAFAGAVAVSRVHVRAHHASDVVGGAVIGVAAGVVGRGLLAAAGRNVADRPAVVRA